MGKAKEHLIRGAFGRAACGKVNVSTTPDVLLVTCTACQRTRLFASVKAPQDRARGVGPQG
jgi:hypothetical protein